MNFAKKTTLFPFALVIRLSQELSHQNSETAKS